MKKIKRKYMVATAILIFTVACAGVGAVYAAESDGKLNSMGDLAAAIAQKFNLSQAEVQKVFDEQKTKMAEQRKANMAQMETKRQEQFAARLSELVAAGKLNQTQADAIKDKQIELQAAREAQKTSMVDMKSMTEAERKAAMEAQKTKMAADRAALEKWATDNGIPKEYIPLAGFMAGVHGRGGRGFGWGNK